ncbi:MAG TPA: alpha/beta hydrolase [Rhizomicrobium sp.]|jgi:acetyl esterase/lipase|nr:alpha/beta hydrolase [Rhizomicrobium sp.]
MDRRTAIGLGVAALTVGAANAQPMRADGYLPGDSAEFAPLWPGTPPGGDGLSLALKVTDAPGADGYHIRAVSQIRTPGFFVYRPAKANRLGLLVIPGGGYSSEGGDRGGREIARHFARLGITCFVLRYRLPGEGWRNREWVPLQDAQRAMRLIRRDAAKYGVDPARIAAIGFSAGGHLSASLGLRSGMKVYEPVDEADSGSAAPIVAGMLYPVITMGPGAHQGSRDHLLGETPTPEAVARHSLEKQAQAGAAPSFICLAADDPLVPPFENGIAYFGALRAVKVPSELHVFEEGGHGFSLHWAAGKPCAAWPSLFTSWAATHGFLKA